MEPNGLVFFAHSNQHHEQVAEDWAQRYKDPFLSVLVVDISTQQISSLTFNSSSVKMPVNIDDDNNNNNNTPPNTPTITTFPAAVEEILNNTTIETGCTFDTVRSVVAQVDDHLVHLTDPANANEDYVQEYYGQFNPFSTLQFAHRITTRTSCFKSAISSCTTDLAF